jgi:hypothetical protein
VGNVFEPYLDLTHDPRALLAVLRAGGTFGDAVAAAQPALSWQTVAVGGPLYRPFAVSLDLQLSRRADLPAERGDYAVIRQSHRLEALGAETEALALLRREIGARPSLPLALALADKLQAVGDRDGAIATLSATYSGMELAASDWGMGRAIAQKFTALGVNDEARAIYRRLLAAPDLPDELRAQFELEGRR